MPKLVTDYMIAYAPKPVTQWGFTARQLASNIGSVISVGKTGSHKTTLMRNIIKKASQTKTPNKPF